MDNPARPDVPHIPEGYQYLEPYVTALLADAPRYESNVFLIMRFTCTKPMKAIHGILCDSLVRMGLHPLRADDKSYHHELWGNICTYMFGCSKAVVVFEDVEQREFNPNVALEFGFMRALNKPCLILKEKRLPQPPTDVIGHLWREFDSFDPQGTIPAQISRWLVDINWTPPHDSLPLPVARKILREASGFHQILEILAAEFDREILFNEQAAKVFETIVTHLAHVGPIFRKQTTLDGLSEDDTEIKDMLLARERIANLYLEKVLLALKDSERGSRDRIESARSGVKEVLQRDLELVSRVERMCASVSQQVDTAQ